jgi:hypothetical protein
VHHPLGHVAHFARRCPEQYDPLIECAPFVHWRRMAQGVPAVLALSFLQAGRRTRGPAAHDG